MIEYQLSAFADEADKMLSAQIAVMAEHRIACLEMRGVDGKSVAELTDEQAREAKRKLDGMGYRLSAMGSPYGKYPVDQPFDAHLAQFRRGLELCHILGADRMRMFSFFIPKGDDAANWRGAVLERLHQMLELAGEAGVLLAHENEKGIYGDTDARCLDLMEHFGGRLGCIFDPANFLQCQVLPAEAFEKLEKYITYLHVKDALLADGSVVPAGRGDGEIARILDRLGQKGAGRMTLTLEPHLRVFDGLSALQGEELAHKYHYPDSKAAFAAAADALKDQLTSIGYHEAEGGQGVWTR